MAAATATVTLADIWHDTKRIHTIGSIAVSASPATYPANGIPISFVGLSASDGTPLPTSNNPERLRVDGVSGFIYVYDKTNLTLRIFQSAGFTPTGTNSAPTITTTTNAGTTAPVYTNSGALTQTTGATGITGVQAPTFTGAAVSAAALVEIATNAAIPAGISGDTISFDAIFKMV